uniref:NADH-ubiquinone oxidoreductase chain 3 n=1 Tax=Diptera sp. 66 LC-2017 TaxID=2030344 RepID=A0A343LA00_9DIPT|nr:NADH dehydrogenase subunit 3 [Diptera sp. 66 LC-2017]
MLMMMLMIFLLISMIIMKMSMLLSMKIKMNFEKMSPFECGFNPIYYKRMPFSIRFFLITIIFLIFDIEIALLLPMIIIMKMSNLMMWLTTSMLFLMILIMGLFHEWNNGALNWI